MASNRPRGFMNDWKPKAHVQELVNNVQEILIRNREFLPLTLRQIYYMLVSHYEFDKTQKAYKRMCETMNKARRSRLISMNDIRDDEFRRLGTSGWRSEASLISSFKWSANNFTFDRQENQAHKIILWCEAGGMAPQLASAVEDYHIPVYSSGGFDSVTTKHSVARRLSNMGEVEILHLGDHDPSGVHLYPSLDEDLQAFLDHYGGDMTLTRWSVTPEQVREMNLPTAPAKATDTRSFVGLTTQCEAIPPRTLRQIVKDAVHERLDWDAYNEDLAEEKRIRVSLGKKLEKLGE